jgi:DNA-binding SARP family transcriptional activator
MNYGRDMGDGQVFTNPSLIEPGWRLVLPAADVALQDSEGHQPPGSATATAGLAHHLGHATHDPHFQRRHQAASQRPAGSAGAAAADGVGGQLASPAGYRTSVTAPAPTGNDLTEAAVFAAGALAGAVLASLTRLRGRQRQYRRGGRRIALPADPHVLAAEQRLYAAAPIGPPSTLQDALSCLESGITGGGQTLPDIVGLHVRPHLLEVLLAAPALDAPPPPYEISPGRQGMCWQLALPAGPGQGRTPAGCGSGLLPGLFTAGSTDDGYLLLDLESLQLTGCDGPPELVDQVVAATATELATRQWSGWYDLLLVGFDELEVLGRAEHCVSMEEALTVLAARSLAVRRRLADQPAADVRQLRLAAPDDEDWGLTILVSRAEPSADQLSRLLELAEDGPGGIAAFVAGDPETADGRMAPTVLQVAPDPQRPGEILANVIPLQIMVSPQVLTAAEYEAISTLFATAADLEDVSPQQAPYEMYAAPPWIPQAATLCPEPAAGHSPWLVADLSEPDDAADDASAGEIPAEAGGEDPGWHDVREFAPPGPWPPANDAPGSGQPHSEVAAPGGPASATPADGIAAPPWALGGQPAPRAEIQPLTVRILGPLVITGAVEQLQPKQAELLLALALAAPGGLSNSALCSMLGADPDHPKPSDAVRQIITRTRRRLGQAADGREYIIHAGNGTYLLHPDASLDWTEFRSLIASSRAEDMRAALAIVRGEPFTGSYYWWIDIPLLETVRAEIVDAAQTLAEFELATGSARAAARAARAGLAAEISAEQLWRLLMRAEHAAGNPGGVAEAWRHCLDAIEDVAPGGEPHPDTAALYRQLTATSRQHARARGCGP